MGDLEKVACMESAHQGNHVNVEDGRVPEAKRLHRERFQSNGLTGSPVFPLCSE